MYFLTDEEKKHLLKGMLPKSRELGVADELRGWNWNLPPLEPIFSTRLALYEVANAYCPTNRDLFLRRVNRVRVKPNEAMIRGAICHAAMVHVLVSAKKLIYTYGVARSGDICRELLNLSPLSSLPGANDLDSGMIPDVEAKVRLVTEFEKARVVARIQEILMKHPHIGEDSLVNLALPVVVEQKLDGSFLGLSANLSADAFVFFEPMILDLKFGEPRDFHRLTTTGYALVMEAIYEFPINLGCLVYSEFRGDRVIVKKDIHFISDELRQWFIEVRDDKARMIEEEIDPGLPDQCYDTCPYRSTCY
jgi:CRISPR-associated protein Csa1